MYSCALLGNRSALHSSPRQCTSYSLPTLRLVRPRHGPVFSTHNSKQRDSKASHRLQAAAGGSGSSGGSGGSGNGGNGGGDGSNSGGSDAHFMQPWTYLFAVLLAAGGIFAFVKKKSAKSLSASMSASLILALAARSMAGATAGNAVRVAFGISLLLAVVMFNRYRTSGKVMPAGMVAGVSAAMALAYAAAGL